MVHISAYSEKYLTLLGCDVQIIVLPLTISISCIWHLQWCPIKVRDFHQNESCPSCPHPPSSYEERREQGRQLSFWWKSLTLIGHYSTENQFGICCKKRIVPVWASITYLRKFCQKSFNSVCTSMITTQLYPWNKHYEGRVVKVGLKRESASCRCKLLLR